MGETERKLYDERLERIRKAIALEPVDKTPAWDPARQHMLH